MPETAADRTRKQAAEACAQQDFNETMQSVNLESSDAANGSKV